MLAGMASKLKDLSAYELLDDDIGYVPYAIVLPLGASGLRQAVNRALSQIYGQRCHRPDIPQRLRPNA